VDEYLTRTDSTGTANFLTDALGSALLLTDNSGSTLAQYAYEPFGDTTVTGSSSSTYQYTGRESDGTGLYFYRARYYSPQFGRFVSEDPIGFGDGPNVYSYVRSSPLNLRDPFGLSASSAASCFLKGAAAGAIGAVIVGGVAVAVAAAGAPVAVVTVGLGAVAIAGTAVWGWNSGSNIANSNWNGLAYNVGSALGGALAGGLGGRAVAEGVNGIPSPPWSWGSDAAQHYDGNLGSFWDWFGTGTNPGGAAGTIATGGAGAATMAGRNCGCNN
jgi:RHS repeat-associated protein